MALIRQIGSYDVALGMSWHSLRGNGPEKSEAKEIAKANAMPFGVLVEHAVVGLIESDPGTRTVCGAAWLAVSAEHDLLLLHRLDEELTWVCAIRNKKPVGELDLVLPHDEAVNRARQELEFLGDGTSLKVYGEPEDIDGAQPADFLSLVFGDDVGESDPPKHAQLTRLYGISPTYKKVALVGALVFGGIWAAREHQFRQQQAESLALREKQVQEVQAQQLKSENERLNSGNVHLQQMFKQRIGDAPSAGMAPVLWMDAVKDVPSLLGNWNLQAITCNKSECLAAYVRPKLAVLSDFVEAAKATGLEIKDIAKDVCSIRLGAQLPSGGTQESDAAPMAEFAVQFLSTLQRLERASLSFTYVEPSAEVYKLAATGGSPEKVFTSTYKIGTYEVSGKQLFEVRQIAPYLDFKNVSATELEILIDRGTWKMKGNYAVK